VTPPAASRSRIVAVDGLDGSGKSQLAAALAAACAADGVSTTVLHVDDFRRDLDFGGLEAAAEGARYYDRYYDLDALEGRLASLFRGGAATAAGLVIVEGVFTLRVPTVATSGAVVLLRVSADEARRRILSRDRAKGRTDEEIQRRIERRYFPGQDRYRAACDPEAHAAAVVDNEDWRRPRVVRSTPGLLPAPVERWLAGLG
jgi:cytidylate kinase